MKEQYPKMATIFLEEHVDGLTPVMYITSVDLIENEVMITDKERVYVIDLDITDFEWYLKKKGILVRMIIEKGTWQGQPDTITYDLHIDYNEWLRDKRDKRENMDKSDEHFSELVACFFSHMGKEYLDEELAPGRALSNELKDL